MAPGSRHPLVAGTLVTSLGTLASRVAGLVRDVATAALFGLAAGGVMDAFVVAFRIPNLFRRLFGEGALTASYLPVFARTHQQSATDAWRLASTTMVWLARLLGGIVVAGEVVLITWAALAADRSHARLLAGLSAVMLPYVAFICLAAINAATLQALGQFAAPAFAPLLLNLCWIAGVIVIAPLLTSDPVLQAYILAGCVLLGGFLQWAQQWRALRRVGFQFQPDFAATRDSLRQIRLGMVPTALALAVTQLNTLMDSLIAWMLSAPRGGPATVAWLGNVRYPMEQGAAAAIYFGERLYQLPLGLLGIAAATVAFPRLSAHAARGDLQAVADDLTLGLRLVLVTAVPCAVVLVILADPIARLLFQRGQFTPDDAARTARMIAVYGSGVWAYCATVVLVRGFYAIGDRITPLRVGLVAVAINFLLNLTLIWPLAEAGLAAATAIAAVVQTISLAVLFSRGRVPLDLHRLGASAVLVVVASAVMGVAGWLTLRQLPAEPGLWNAVLRVAVPLVACAAGYALALAAIGRSECRELFARRGG